MMLERSRQPLSCLANRLHLWRWESFLELAARGGYVARGFIYLSIGGIALFAALRLTPKAEGATGAMQAWGDWPLGVALLWLTGLGLYAFAGWRVLQSLFDADRQGHDPKAILSRAGQAVSGILYATLGVSVFGLLDAFEDLSETDDQAATAEKIGETLALPYGEWLVMGAGAFILACGVGNIVRGIFGEIGRDLDCGHQQRRWLGLLGRAGYIARGVAFLPAGAFTVLAGVHTRSAEAKGLGGALGSLQSQPFGDVILAFVAAGLVAFGLFAFVEARFRAMRPAEALKEALSD